MAETDTYPLIPDKIATSAPEFKTTIVDFESGNEQRLANWANPKTTFRLIHKFLTQERLSELLEFFKYKKGSWKKFYFINHHDGQTYTVRFKADSMSITNVNANLHDVEVEVVTC